MTNKRIKKRKIVLGIIIFVIICIVYGFIEPYWIQIKKTTITSQDLPASFDGTKIVYVSDIHHGPYFSRERVKDLVVSINKLKPDIVLLGGDYVNKSPEYIGPCFEELSHIQANAGKFGVLGNHDHWESLPITLSEAKNAGFTMLDNKASWVEKNGERIKIGGVGDLWSDSQDLAPTLDDTRENDYIILLSHNPDYAEKVTTHNVDLILSGHTHGGQMTFFGVYIPFTPPIYLPKYRSGLVKTDYTTVLVSNGIGTITPPFRFFVRPQINVITLKRSK